MPDTNHDGRACEPTTLVRSRSVTRHPPRSPGREGERPRRILHEQSMPDGLVQPALDHERGEPVEQPGQARGAIVDVVVAPPCGVHPEQDLAVQAVLDGPLQQLERAVRLLPAERLVVLPERATPQQLAVVAAVDDLVDVAERDVLRRDAVVGQEPELLEGAGPGLAMGQDRHPGREMGERGRLEDAPIALRRAVGAAGDLDDPGAMGRPLDDRPAVVVQVDAVGDVEDEQGRDLLDPEPGAPVGRTVVAVVVQAGRGDDVDPGPASRGRPASGHSGRRRTASHPRRRPGPSAVASPTSVDHRVHVAEIEVRLHQDRPAAVDDDVLVRVGHAESRRVRCRQGRSGRRSSAVASWVGRELEDGAVGLEGGLEARRSVDVARIVTRGDASRAPRPCPPPGPSPCTGPSSGPRHARRASPRSSDRRRARWRRRGRPAPGRGCRPSRRRAGTCQVVPSPRRGGPRSGRRTGRSRRRRSAPARTSSRVSR